MDTHKMVQKADTHAYTLAFGASNILKKNLVISSFFWNIIYTTTCLKIVFMSRFYDPDKLEREINHRSFQKKRPISSCEQCGRPIYTTDKDGLPYRLCYTCNRAWPFRQVTPTCRKRKATLKKAEGKCRARRRIPHDLKYHSTPRFFHFAHGDLRNVI